MDIQIVKNNGAIVSFDSSILFRSLLNAGANKDYAKDIVRRIEADIKNGDTTSLIYKKAFDILYKESESVAMQYSLKKALFGLGPTGFQFEKFVSELFKRKGYSTAVGVHLKGTCIEHEVDVHAVGKERIAIEAKFHNDIRTRTDVKTVLYIKARFDDLLGKTHNKTFSFRKEKGIVDRCILITNTKFSSSAIKYAKCAGIELIGWGFPANNSLQKIIDEVDAHPVTCLPSIDNSSLRKLYENDIVTCRTLLDNTEILASLKNHESIKQEASILCRSQSRN